jgi:predicted nucleotidyltransferase
VSATDPGLEANTALLRLTVARLGDLSDELVFVGGCATGLLITAMRAQSVRVTTDVDVIVQVATIRDYYAIEARLQGRGFARDMSPEAPICRWVAPGLQLDVMPSEPDLLGFSNRWYPLAVTTARPYALASERTIRLVTAPLFVATKLEAFRGRGKGDYLASHDLEDIVTVVDGRAELTDEVIAAPAPVREYLQASFASLVADERFVNALAGHLSGDPASQGRLPLLLDRLRRLAERT